MNNGRKADQNKTRIIKAVNLFTSEDLSKINIDDYIFATVAIPKHALYVLGLLIKDQFKYEERKREIKKQLTGEPTLEEHINEEW